MTTYFKCVEAFLYTWFYGVKTDLHIMAATDSALHSFSLLILLCNIIFVYRKPRKFQLSTKKSHRFVTRNRGGVCGWCYSATPLETVETSGTVQTIDASTQTDDTLLET